MGSKKKKMRIRTEIDIGEKTDYSEVHKTFKTLTIFAGKYPVGELKKEIGINGRRLTVYISGTPEDVTTFNRNYLNLAGRLLEQNQI